MKGPARLAPTPTDSDEESNPILPDVQDTNRRSPRLLGSPRAARSRPSAPLAGPREGRDPFRLQDWCPVDGLHAYYLGRCLKCARPVSIREVSP